MYQAFDMTENNRWQWKKYQSFDGEFRRKFDQGERCDRKINRWAKHFGQSIECHYKETWLHSLSSWESLLDSEKDNGNFKRIAQDSKVLLFVTTQCFLYLNWQLNLRLGSSIHLSRMGWTCSHHPPELYF